MRESFTVDTHGLHKDFRSGKQKSCFVTLYVNRGVRFTFDWVRLAQQPLDALKEIGRESSSATTVIREFDVPSR